MSFFKTETQKNIESSIGLSLEEIKNMDMDQLDNYVESKIKRQLILKNPIDNRLTSRGNVLIDLNRLDNMSLVNKKYKKLKAI